MVTTTPATIPADDHSPLAKYKHMALEALALILQSSDSDRERRLAAATMLKYIAAAEPPPEHEGEPIRETSRPLSERRQREQLAREGDEQMARQDAELADAYDVGYSDALEGNHKDPTAARIADAYTRGYNDAHNHKPRDPITMGMLAFEALARIAEEEHGGPDVPFCGPAEPLHDMSPVLNDIDPGVHATPPYAARHKLR